MDLSLSRYNHVIVCRLLMVHTMTALAIPTHSVFGPHGQALPVGLTAGWAPDKRGIRVGQTSWCLSAFERAGALIGYVHVCGPGCTGRVHGFRSWNVVRAIARG